MVKLGIPRGTVLVLAASGVFASSAAGSAQEIHVKGTTTLHDSYDPSTIYPWFGRVTYTRVKAIRPRGATVSGGLASKARSLCEQLFVHGAKHLYPHVQIFDKGGTRNLSNPGGYTINGQGHWQRSAYPGPKGLPPGDVVRAVAGFWDSTYTTITSEIQKTITYRHATVLVDCDSNFSHTLKIP